MARFQNTGATYEMKNRRWLFRIPAGEEDRHQRGRDGDADERDPRGDGGQEPQRRTRESAGLLGFASLDQLGVDRNQRRGERALAEQVLHDVR
jgi:hypothetical protein